MKKVGTLFAIIAACVLLMGAGRQDAPVLPTKSFYINDHANIIDVNYRDAMLKEAREIYGRTGAQIVVLTVNNLAGMDNEQYASLIFNGWGIGGETHENGILLLIDTESNTICATPGENISKMLSEISGDLNKADAKIKAKDYSDGIGMCFFAVADKIREKNGLSAAEGLGNVKKASETGSRNYYIASAGIAIIILLRVWRTSLRTRKRFGKKMYSYKHREFSNPYTRTGARRYDEDYPSGFGGNILIKTRETDGEEETDEFSSEYPEDGD